MGFQVSPGVEVKEIDLTNVIPAVSTSIGGFAGYFKWGPVNQVTLLSSENELANQFGKPDALTAESFFTAASFLNYGTALNVVRASDTAGSDSTLLNAVAGGVSGALATLTLSTSVDNLTENQVLGVTDSSTTPGSDATVRGIYQNDQITVNDGGADYATGDEIEISLGGNKTLVVEVSSVDADGAVTAVTETYSPELTNITLVNEVPSTGGSGSGAIFDLTYILNNLEILNGGSGYDAADVVINNVSSGSDLSTSATVTVGTATAELIENEDVFETMTGLTGQVYARYPGALGNSLDVYVLDSTNFGTVNDSISGLFDSAPTGNEVHIAVVDADGEFSGGVEGTVVETWSFLDKTLGAKKEDGSNNYFVDVINQSSRWIYLTSSAAAGQLSLTGGFDVDTDGLNEAGNITAALDLLSDSETLDVNLLFSIADANGSAVIANHLHGIAIDRKDCVAFLSPPTEATAGSTNPRQDVIDWVNTISVRDSGGSYAVIDSTAIYTYNRYADNYLYIPASGHIAGLCAKTDDLAEPWFSPAGFNRGSLKSVVKLAYNPKKADRDELYKRGINPIATFPGQGTVLFGDKTAQAKPSAFDRINVRRLFIVLEKAIATASKYQLFELNDEFTRAMFRNMVEPFLRDVQGRRGIYDFAVICDETNNTGEVIDTNRFVADIYIKPARSINFITLNFIATRTGVDFSEVAGLSNG
jgi:hypothetical protein